jgi:hypothetical protein
VSKRRLTVRVASSVIGVPVDQWPGRCHTIAGFILAAGLVRGRLRYGMWLGPISEKCERFSAARGFVHHGWIETADSEVVDPTRWVFEAADPYIYIGKNDGSYDNAGGTLRAITMGQFPMSGQSDGGRRVELKLSRGAALTVMGIISRFNGGLIARRRGALLLDTRQVSWIANIPLQMLEEHARELYAAIKAVGLGAYVPIDNMEVVFGDGWYGQEEAMKASLKRRRRARDSESTD